LESDDPEFYYQCSHEIRAVINFLIQGPAGVITNFALMEIDAWFQRGGWKKEPPLLVHQIHDSVVIDCPKWCVKDVARITKRTMEKLDLAPYTGNRLRYAIPLKAEVKVGDSL
jgi:DNA polymerase I-like protein with 3'-5' exonuclease and polymerase domains